MKKTRIREILGLVNGYFIAGSLWSYMDKAGYPLQYVTPLPDQDFKVTITLSDHGDRTIELPAPEQTVNAADQPEIAAQVGV